jgi:hypothetical protein
MVAAVSTAHPVTDQFIKLVEKENTIVNHEKAYRPRQWVDEGLFVASCDSVIGEPHVHARA